MALVLDASAALPWCFRDEETEGTRALLAQVVAGDLVVVPEHWRIELLNVLLMGVRRGRVSDSAVKTFWEDLSTFDISAEQRPLSEVYLLVQPLATLHRLTAYDAAYLEVALRRRLPLATLDTDLAYAARREGVSLLL